MCTPPPYGWLVDANGCPFKEFKPFKEYCNTLKPRLKTIEFDIGRDHI